MLPVGINSPRAAVHASVCTPAWHSAAFPGKCSSSPCFPSFYPAGNGKVQALRHTAAVCPVPGRGGEDGEVLKTQMLLLHFLFHSYPQTIPTKTAILSSSSRPGSKSTSSGREERIKKPAQISQEKPPSLHPGVHIPKKHPMPFLVTPAGGKAEP